MSSQVHALGVAGILSLKYKKENIVTKKSLLTSKA